MISFRFEHFNYFDIFSSHCSFIDVSGNYLHIPIVSTTPSTLIYIQATGTGLSQAISYFQGRIYAANDYPTFARTILIVCQKSRISRQNYFE